MIFDQVLSSYEAQQALSEVSFVQAMLDTEAALAVAQSEVGIIPAGVGESVAKACDARKFDIQAMLLEGAHAGTLVIPLVRQLTAAVATDDPTAASFVHWGATSQDILDTAQVLIARKVLALVDRDLCALTAALSSLAEKHAAEPLLGRTLLQPAQVISVDFKVATWLAPLVRAQLRIRRAGQNALQVQLGGAVGTCAAMGEQGVHVMRRMAQSLGLRVPDASWHTQRDELAALACELTILAGSLGKVAKDVSLMSQGEISEVAEPSGGGRGGSSTMPHKRNPVGCMVALSAAIRAPQHLAALLSAMPQEHERGLGNWQAELAEFSALLACVQGATAAFSPAAQGLRIDAVRMAANIDAMQGQVFAESLSMRAAEVVGKAEAHHWVARLSRQAASGGLHLRTVAKGGLGESEVLGKAISLDDLEALFDVRTPATHASRLAQPQLSFIRQCTESMSVSAPWQDWLPHEESR